MPLPRLTPDEVKELRTIGARTLAALRYIKAKDKAGEPYTEAEFEALRKELIAGGEPMMRFFAERGIHIEFVTKGTKRGRRTRRGKK